MLLRVTWDVQGADHWEGNSMRDLPLLVLEMERQGKRLNNLLRVGHLNVMTWDEFQELTKIVERLQVNLTDFNVAHFGPQAALETQEVTIVKRPTRSARSLA
jgi:hypothetical protein